MDKKNLIIAGIASTGIMAIAGVGTYFSPYLTINNLKNATANRNADALSQEIDFPSFRMSIKENVTAQVIKQMTETGIEAAKASPESVEKIVSPMVDKIVTPEGLENLMQDKLPGAKIDLSNLERDLARSEVKMGYESFDRFVVHITNKTDRTKDVSLILKRDGLSWKLAKIDISKVYSS
jgi:Protein of unknown function (DUF2939)